MKEFEYTFQKGLQHGLSPDKGNPTNSEFLSDCWNVKCSPLGLVSYNELAAPFSNTVIWPFPQFFAGMTQGLLCTGTEVFVVGSDYSQTFKVSTSQGTFWSLADFGPYVILANGVSVVIPSMTTGVWSAYTTAPSTTLPLLGTVCNFKGQLVGGNVKSDWYGEGSNSVVWSDIGSVNCTPGLKNEAGHRPMNWNGSVLMVKRLGDFCLVYGDSGISALVPAQQMFGLKEVPSGGILWAGAVGGDLEKHLFVSSENELWLIEKTLDPKRLGYREILKDMTNPVVSHDPTLDEFHVSDDVSGYVLTFTARGSLVSPAAMALTKCYQRPTSVGNFGGKRVGMSKNSDDYSVQVVTDVMDFGVRSLKTVAMIECDFESDVPLYLAVDYRYDKRGSFTRSAWRLTNKEGVAWCGVTAVDFRICLKSVITTGDTLVMEDGSTIVLEDGSELLTEGSGQDDFRNFKLSKINCKIKFTDKRFMVRGPYQRNIQNAT